MSRTSALSILNFRVQRLQFRSGIFDFELPVNASLLVVAVLRPRGDFAAQVWDRPEPPAVEALALQGTELILGDVEPTPVLRRIAELDLAHELTGFRRGEGLVERPDRARIQVIADHDDLLRPGVPRPQQGGHLPGPIGLRAVLADPHVPPPGQRLGEHEDARRPGPLVLVIDSPRAAPRRRDRPPRLPE